MAYRSRYLKNTQRKSKHNLLASVIIIILLLWISITWVIPNLVNGLGFINKIFKKNPKVETPTAQTSSLAPPVVFIPYEATNTAQIKISGYGASNSKVRIYLDNELKNEVSVSPEGSFLTTELVLSIGTNNIYATAIDSDNKESLPSKTIRLYFDNEKPTLEITEPEDNKEIKDTRKVKISGKTEVGAQVFVNSSQVIIDSEGKFQTELSLSDGENIFTIKAQDKATNYTEIIRRILFKPS